MPISKEQRALYPAEWATIAAEVREREGNCCKICRVPNGAVILRPAKSSNMAGLWIEPASGKMFELATGEMVGYCRGSEFPAGKMVKIVLTVAHLNHDVTDNGVPGNRPMLAALCQLHHLRHDLEHHKANAARTRAAKRATGDLFT